MILEFGNCEVLHEWGVILIFVERKFLEERKLVADCRAALWAKLVLRVFSYSSRYSNTRENI